MINMSTSLFRRGVLILLFFLVSSGNTTVIYKDIISGDEMFSGVFPITTFLDCFIKVQGKTKTLVGGNAVDGVAEETEDGKSVTTIDIVLSSRLVPAPPFNNKSFKTYIKPYMQKLVARMKQEEIGQETIDEFKRTLEIGVKYLLENIKDFDIFTGQSMNPDGSLGFMNYEEDGMTPYMLFFKHGLIEESV